jgi:hypothetical protein
MPHPRPTHELPEYPVRPRPTPRAVVPVWDRWPLGSRLVAAGLAAVVLAVVVGVLRGSPGTADEASGLVLDVSAAPTDGGMATSPTDTTVDPALLFEGTLPPTAATAPPAVAAVARATAAPARAPTRSAAAAAASTAATKPATAAPTAARAPVTTVKKPSATTAKAPATTRAPTTAPKAVVKPPATTTATTVKRTTTTTVAAKETWTPDEVQALIRAMWPGDSVDRALQVAYNESRYRSDAYNGNCCYGVFQISASAHAERLRARGLSTADLYDAKVNIEIAVEIFQESGWGPWGG